MALETTDMRKSFDGLANETQRVMEKDPLSGHLFVFFNRRRTLAHLLEPSAKLIFQRAMQSHVLQVDDTKLPVQDRAKAKNIKRGHIWALVGVGCWMHARRHPRKGSCAGSAIPNRWSRNCVPGSTSTRHGSRNQRSAGSSTAQKNTVCIRSTNSSTNLTILVLKAVHHFTAYKYACLMRAIGSHTIFAIARNTL